MLNLSFARTSTASVIDKVHVLILISFRVSESVHFQELSLSCQIVHYQDKK